MKKYIVDVREAAFAYSSAEKRRALEAQYISPIVELDFEDHPDASMDCFIEKYGMFFRKLFNPVYIIMPAQKKRACSELGQALFAKYLIFDKCRQDFLARLST